MYLEVVGIRHYSLLQGSPCNVCPCLSLDQGDVSCLKNEGLSGNYEEQKYPLDTSEFHEYDYYK